MVFNREIYTHSAAAQLAPLLQGVFAGELIFPGKELWFWSPWISDIPLLDNRANSFKHVDPLWPRSMISLSRVLEKILDSECQVFIITNDKPHNHSFIKWIKRIQRLGYENLHYKVDYQLHSKGILGDDFYLNGSMNFTHSGISFSKERVKFTNTAEEIGQAKIEFKTHWESIT